MLAGVGSTGSYADIHFALYGQGCKAPLPSQYRLKQISESGSRIINALLPRGWPPGI